MPSTTPRPRGPLRSAARFAVIALLIGSSLSVAPILPHPQAEAAVVGRMIAFGGWQVGAFVSSTGEYVYCVEPGSVEPSGNQQAGRTVSSLPAYSGGTFDPSGWSGDVSSGPLSGKKLREINYLLWQYGRTTDLGTAVAVQIAIWLLRDDPGARVWLDHHLTWMRRHGGGGYIDSAVRIAAEARAAALPAARPTPDPLRIERSEGVGERGEYGGEVHYPSGTTVLRISGGTFANGDQELHVEDGRAGIAEWRAVPHRHGWRGSNEVAVTGEWRIATQGWPDAVRLFAPVVAGQQRLVAGVARASVTFTGSLRAADVEDARFSPVLSTRVPERFLQGGDPFADTVTLASATNSRAWPSRLGENGAVEFAPVVAAGTVYGPFEEPQTQALSAPSEAPIAGRAELVAGDGPGEYEVVSADVVESPGYYYWVWRIIDSEQLPEVRDGGLLPAGYRYADEFGMIEEGHVVPGALRWRTRLLEQELDPARPVLQDLVTPSAEGGVWLRDLNGERIPVRIRLTVYRSEHVPVRTAQAPDGAVEIARGFVELHEPDAEVAADPIALPPGTRGWVTVQACLLEEDQPEDRRGYAEEWCDDYGVPEETARVSPEPLSETGIEDAPAFGAVPLIAGALIYAGANTLALGLLLRSVRGRSRA